MDNEKLAATARLTISGTEQEQAIAYCFLATSVLRVLTKSSENFCKAWGHIQEGHRTYYASQCPISGIAPSSVGIRSKAYQPHIDNLQKLIMYITDPSDAHRRQQWRYGRIFDQNFVYFTNQILSKACCYIGISFTTSKA
ncbi:uncharacterized protein LOC111283656 isoform X2 [Durio zibethinus]|uniref:Uncharacterized protein LOC111283656 isoform X2 n=1 Tax=Durio zibethinus TaxID=66656 RepID=A0A6P5XIG0_DURZI|nr:uncharacterized protein LOC111283656 isoform X2 [Durio zibethinus]